MSFKVAPKKNPRRSSIAAVIDDVRSEFDSIRFALMSKVQEPTQKGAQQHHPRRPQNARADANSSSNSGTKNGSGVAWTLAPMSLADFRAIPLKPKESTIDEAFRTPAVNRYKDVLPYEHNRVHLSVFGGQPESAYVNASYIRGPDGSEKAFIAAMAPKPSTVQSFWRMIWQERVSTIVMLCLTSENGKDQCTQYWGPKPGNKVKVAGMMVETKRVVRSPRNITRTILTVVSPSGEERTLQHLQYGGWVSLVFLLFQQPSVFRSSNMPFSSSHHPLPFLKSSSSSVLFYLPLVPPDHAPLHLSGTVARRRPRIRFP